MHFHGQGIVEEDKRDGRRDIQKVKDEKLHYLVRVHIDRFPKIESHYCRQKTTRQYLSSDSTLKCTSFIKESIKLMERLHYI